MLLGHLNVMSQYQKIIFQNFSVKKGFYAGFYIVLLGLTLVSFGRAQQCLNFIAVNGRLLEGQTACYFINQGDNQNAFVNADTIARELGVLVTFDSGRQTLLFSRGTDLVELQVTTDAPTGLVKRSGTMTINGETLDSPMGIIAGGTSYVAVTPIVKAFNGESAWDASSRTILVYTAKQPQVSATISGQVTPTSNSSEVSANVSNPTPEQSNSQTISGDNAQYLIKTPRIGKHEGYTRVALDLPVGTNYTTAINGTQLIISLPSLKADSFYHSGDGPYVESVRYEIIGSTLALIINARYALSSEGYGYRIGVVPANGSNPHEVIYIDFSTSIYGQSQQTGEASTAPTQGQNNLPAQSRAVVIDPGHGGSDPGAQGVVSEEEVVLDVSLKLKELLERQGITVIMTRSGDYSLKDTKRADLAARAAMATREDRNLFISIHANSAGSNSANGIETWVFGKPVDASLLDIAIDENGGGELGEALTLESQKMFESIVSDIVREEQLRLSKTLAEMVQAGMITETSARDRGIHENYFYVIRNAQTPAVLVELGFVNNPTEGSKLSTSAYRQKLADGLYNGIMSFFAQGR